jgi:hypothetical protein
MTGVDPLYRPALWVGSIGLVAWGLCLAIIPEHVLAWSNTGPMNPSITGTLGAAMVGLAIVLLYIAFDQTAKLVQAVAIAVAIMVLMRFYLMFVTGSVIINTATLGSAVIGAGVAIIMFMKGDAPAATPKKK